MPTVNIQTTLFVVRWLTCLAVADFVRAEPPRDCFITMVMEHAIHRHEAIVVVVVSWSWHAR